MSSISARSSIAPSLETSEWGVAGAVTASVVLYKTPEAQIARLLDCIRNSSVQMRTYLVDNSPEPLSYACLRSEGVEYVRAESNRGYGAGHNIVLRKILKASEFHFVLNPDIYFQAKELERMLRFIKEDPTIGQLMPKVLYPDGSLQYLCKLLPTPADLFLRRFSFGPLKKWTAGRAEQFELRHTGYDKVMDVPYLSGCFMLFRVSALRRVGLFDERFFMYPEDVDITRRVHAKYRTVFFPGATIVHDHGRESYKTLRALWTHSYNMARYFNKWGWLRDSQRSIVNLETLEQLREVAILPEED